MTRWPAWPGGLSAHVSKVVSPKDRTRSESTVDKGFMAARTRGFYRRNPVISPPIIDPKTNTIMAGEVFAKIVELISTKKSVPAANVTIDSSFESLGMDSLDAVELVSDLEEIFNVNIPNAELHHFKTIRQAVAGLEKAIAQ
jgi:acyl carrier protein